MTSDKGPTFASAWWFTLCACHGTTPRCDQAYHHQANGRAENACQQINRKLRKLLADASVLGTTWVELLPCAVRAINDAPGESGWSPYELVHGRHRPMAGLPYRPLREAEGATAFFTRMEKWRTHCAVKLEMLHERRAGYVNRIRRDPRPLALGAKVWYASGAGRPGLDSKWQGPCVVVDRVGDHSYRVQVSEDRVVDAHMSQLWPHVEDQYSDSPFPLYYFSGKAPVVNVGPGDYVMEKVVRHRPAAKGGREYMVKWENYPLEEATWESEAKVPNFMLEEYARSIGGTLKIDLGVPDDSQSSLVGLSAVE